MVNLVGDGPNIVLLAYFGNTRQFSGRSYRAGRIAGELMITARVRGVIAASMSAAFTRMPCSGRSATVTGRPAAQASLRRHRK